MSRRLGRLCAVALLPARACGGGGPRLFANVATKYLPIRHDSDLFEPNKVGDWLHPDFLQAMATIRDAEVVDASPTGLVKDFVTEEAPGIYSFPLLKDAACDRLISEVDAFAASVCSPVLNLCSSQPSFLLIDTVLRRASLHDGQTA